MPGRVDVHTLSRRLRSALRSTVRGRAGAAGALGLVVVLGVAASTPTAAVATGDTPPASFAVSCSVNPVPVDSTTVCTVVVEGDPTLNVAPTGQVQFGASTPSAHVLLPPCTLSPINPSSLYATCSTPYMPTGAVPSGRKDVVYTDYLGDDTYSELTAKYVVSVNSKLDPVISTCDRIDTRQGDGVVACQVTVSSSGSGAPTPTGTLALTMFDGTASYNEFLGTLKPTSSCSLKATAGGLASCIFTYQPPADPPIPQHLGIYVLYSGDSHYQAPFFATGIPVTITPKETPIVSPTCSTGLGNEIAVNTPIVCSLDIASAPNPTIPTGDVAFKLVRRTGSGGTFTTPRCSNPDGSSFLLHCESTFTPSGTGSATRTDTVVMTYTGDNTFSSVTTSADVKVRPLGTAKAQFHLSCSPAATYPGASVVCGASVVVSGVDSIGWVSFTPPSNGTLDRLRCQLQPGSPFEPGFSSCTVNYTPKGTGSNTRSDTLAAKFLGDPSNAPASTSTKVGVRPPPATTTTLTCTSQVTVPGQTTTCTANVSGGGSPIPTGKVTFSVPNNAGVFSATSCDLTYVRPFDIECSVNYTPSGTGSPTRKDVLTAKYGGDVRDAPSSGTYTLKVEAFT